jgi:hypothetical protein
MSHASKYPYETDKVDNDKAFIRSMTDRALVNSFRLHGLSLAEMDRGELLGVICWLIKNPDIYRNLKQDEPQR